jgi:hypothetical protein
MSGADILYKSGNDRLAAHALVQATRGFNGFRDNSGIRFKSV